MSDRHPSWKSVSLQIPLGWNSLTHTAALHPKHCLVPQLLSPTTLSLLTLLPCSLHWLLTLESDILMPVQLPQNVQTRSAFFSNSICDSWLPVPPAPRQPGHRPGLQCPPPPPAPGFQMPPNTHNGHYLTSCKACFLSLLLTAISLSIPTHSSSIFLLDFH